MCKLTLKELKEKAESVVAKDLLNTISGGLSNDCHDTVDTSEFDICDKCGFFVRKGWQHFDCFNGDI